MIQRAWLEGGNGTFMAHSFQQTTPALLNLAIFLADFGEMAWNTSWINEMKSGYTTGNMSCLYVEDDIFIITNEYMHAIPPFHIHRDLLVKLVNAWKEIYQKNPDRIDLTQEDNNFTFELNTQEGHKQIVVHNENGDKDEIYKLVDTLNEMLCKTVPNYIKIYELLKKQNIAISFEDLENFKPKTMNYDHVFRPNPQFKYDPITDLYDAKMSGHHLDKGLCKVKYGPEISLPGGATQKDVNFQGLLKKNNCYFPVYWTEKNVINAVIEVLKNPNYATLRMDKLEIQGIYQNIKMTVILDRSKVIITSYPNRI